MSQVQVQAQAQPSPTKTIATSTIQLQLIHSPTLESYRVVSRSGLFDFTSSVTLTISTSRLVRESWSGKESLKECFGLGRAQVQTALEGRRWRVSKPKLLR